MALTLSQLLAPQTVDQWRVLLLGSLQGLGIVIKTGTGAGGVGTGTGSVSLSGTPASAYAKIIINITTAGEQGSAAFQYSLDGGATFTAGITIPANPGAYLLSITGVTVTFASGLVGAGTSFALSDQYTFALQIPSLPVTSWGASGAYRQLVEIEAQALAAFSVQQSALAAGGFTTQATGAWADLVGNNFYSLARQGVGALAGVTKGQVTITDSAAAGPFTITVGSMWFAAGSGQLYSNTTGGTLTKSGSLALQVAAQSSGSTYNVGNGTITSIVAGNLAGVTVNNPDPGTGTWITSQGTDAETDSAYMLRCQQRWPSLGTGSPAAAYQLWATQAEAAATHTTTVTKTLVQPDGAIAGQIDIYLAGSVGSVGGSAITDVTSYITTRVALPATISVVSATNAVMTVAGTVNYFAAKATTTVAQAAVAAALAAYLGPLGIGSDAGGLNVKVYYSEIEAAVGSVLGGAGVVIRNLAGFTLNAGVVDVGLTLGQVATLTNSLSFTGV